MSRFSLSIDLNNDAMRTGGNVADALREVADKIDSRLGNDLGDAGKIRDLNGNSVGRWSVA